MLLAVDIGNSNVVIALHDGQKWVHLLRMPTLPEESPLYYKMKVADHFFENGIDRGQVDRIILSSVVPEMRLQLASILEELFGQEVIIVGPAIYPKIPLRIVRTDQIGTDLVANAAAAYALLGKDTIVVDFGTALSITIVNAKGEIEGVNIAPGLKTAIKALVGNTAQLPEVPLEMPQSAIGKDTITAIQSGILIGYVGLVRHQLASIRSELGAQYIAVATGGLSSILTELEDEFVQVNKNWTLEGLRIIADWLSSSH